MSFRCSGIFSLLLTTAALLTGLPLYSEAAEEQVLPIDKVFTTAYQREYMDTLRREYLRRQQRGGFDIDQDIPSMVEESGEEEASTPILFHLGGIMTRNDGSRVVWLNGIRTEEADLPDTMSLRNNNGSPALRITEQEQSYLLRPGQTLNLDTGSLLEAYELPQSQ